MSDQVPASSAAAVRKAVVLLFVLTLVGTLAWISAIFLAPYFRSRAPGTASFIYALFSPVCHQIPGRSFSFGGFPLAVCGRCLGVYAGFLVGLLIYPLARGFSRISLPPGRLFLALSIPIGLDFAGGFTGIAASPIGVRFATGVLWGSILPFYFITGVSELILWRAVRRKRLFAPPGAQNQTLDHCRGKNVE